MSNPIEKAKVAIVASPTFTKYISYEIHKPVVKSSSVIHNAIEYKTIEDTYL